MIGYLKAAQLLAVSLLLGGPFFLALVWAPALRQNFTAALDAALRDRVRWIAIVAALALSALALTDLLRLAAQLSQQGLMHASTVSLASQLALDTSLGRATILRAILAVGALAFLPWRPLDRLSAPLFFLASLGLMATFSLTGHAAGAGAGPVVADLVHMVATVAWYGGLTCFAILPWSGLLRESDTGIMQRLFQRFSTLGLIAVGVLTLTGIFMASLRLYGLEALVEHDYGRTLVVKLGFLGGVLLLAALNLFWVGPRLRCGDALTPRAGGFLRWFVTGEAALGLAVVVVAGLLATTSPPQGAPVRLGVTLSQEPQQLELSAPRNQLIRLTVVNQSGEAAVFVIKSLPHDMVGGGHQHGGGAADMPVFVAARAKETVQFVVRRSGTFSMEYYPTHTTGAVPLGKFHAQ